MRFEAVPLGAFDLMVARDYFDGWLELDGDRAGSLVVAFPVEGWQTSAAVIVHQDAQGVVSGEVNLDSTTLPASGAAALAARAWDGLLATLSLDHDGSGFAAVGERDATIGAIQKHYDYMRPMCAPTPYEAGVARVLGQRLSIAQQRRIRHAMAEQHGAGFNVQGQTVHAFPRPQQLLEIEEFTGVSAEKMARLHALATAALNGSLDRDRLRQLPFETAVAEMRDIHGVGEWTSQGIVLRGAGLVDEVPDDDVTKLAVQEAYRLAVPPTQAEVLEIAEAWRPYRMWTVVLLHVWLRREVGGPRRGARP